MQAQVAGKPEDACHERSTEPVSLRTMAQTHESFPLFPLGLVLLPHELVPLHIFEERYKTMIGECLEQETQFGIVWLSDDGLREVGCSARIVRVLESFDDGRINILVEGTEPFRLMRRIEDLPYPAGDIEALQDDDDGGDSTRPRRLGVATPICWPRSPTRDPTSRSSTRSTPMEWRPPSTLPSRRSRCYSSSAPSVRAWSGLEGRSPRRSAASATPSGPNGPAATAACVSSDLVQLRRHHLSGARSRCLVCPWVAGSRPRPARSRGAIRSLLGGWGRPRR